jgi:NAD(P)-dependent dehydrogenase (short-subunit alcohol dehydrogenase family)
MNDRLSGKVAVITGGASGIGEASVREFVARGCRVVVADVLDEQGRALVRSLGDAVADFVHADVSVEADVKRAVGRAVERFGRLDCMFNNAGAAGVHGPIADTPVEGFDRTIAVLLRGVFLGMKHAAPVLVAQRSGSILSTASVAGIGIGLGPHVYSAAKAAVIHLTRSVAVELAEQNVRVNCICPGGIATPIFGRAVGLSAEGAQRTVDTMANILSTIQPWPRSGQPQDIARAAVFLASEDASFVTGHALVVDGAITLGRKWSEREAEGQKLKQVLERIGGARG